MALSAEAQRTSNHPSLVDVLQRVKEEREVMFVYASDVVANQYVRADVDYTQPIGKLLQQILAPLQLKADSIRAQTYVIRRNIISKTSPSPSPPTVWQISGVVQTEADSPLVGAVVRNQAGKLGTLTDAQGKFQLELLPKAETLVISHLGFSACTVLVANEGHVHIRLHPIPSQLEEVVVLGYGSRPKGDLTGAVASVDARSLEAFASVDVVRNLQGKVAGLHVTAHSGAPSSGNLVRLRGIGSFADSNPLMVVDGFLTKDISYLSPEQIESIEVLKDASATAIYGSRGANGVIMITTRTGKAGPATLTIDSYLGVQHPWRTMEVLDAETYSRAYVEAVSPQRFDPGDIPSEAKQLWILDGLAQRTLGTDWQEEVFRQGIVQGHSLQARGGEEHVNYSIGLNYTDQAGIIKNTASNRLLGYASLGYQLKPWFKLRSRYHFSRHQASDYTHNPYVDPIGTALRKDPLTPTKDLATGHWDRSSLTDLPNPSRIAYEQQYPTHQDWRHLFNLQAELDIFPELTLRSLFVSDWIRQHTSDYSPTNTTVESKHRSLGLPLVSQSETQTVSSLREQEQYNNSWQTSHYLTWNRQTRVHRWEGIAGLEMSQHSQEEREVQVDHVPEPANLRYISLGTHDSSLIVNDYAERYRLLSYFGRLFYAFDNRLLLTATLRFDGSSKFSPRHRWGAFPSFALGWNIHQEAFFQAYQTWSRLKLRASWGQTGNQDPIGPYDIYPLLTSGFQYTFDNRTLAPGLASTKLSNPTLVWETSLMLNFGVDMSWYADRLTVTLDYFDKKTHDLLVPELPTPNFSGTQGPASNAASMRNRGFEATVGLRQDWSRWHIAWTGNCAWQANQVTDLGTGEVIFGGRQEAKIGMAATRTVVGSEFGSFWALQTDGLFQNEAEVAAHQAQDGHPIQPQAKPGDVRYVDADKDGRITQSDAVYMGSALPTFVFGSHFSLRYRQIDLSATLFATQGNEIVNGLTYYLRGTNPAANNLLRTRYENRWTAPGQEDAEPRITDEETTNDLYSDRFIEDGSYFRLQNLQLGLSLPDALIQQWGLSTLRLYVSGDNLLTFTAYQGLDPEVGAVNGSLFSLGVDFGTYPIARRLIGGVSVVF